MKKTDLNADKERIERSQLPARRRAFDALMKRLRHVNAGRHFSRDKMNERRPSS
jgi:hypothetical protein